MKKDNVIEEVAAEAMNPEFVDVKIVFGEDGDYLVDNGVTTGPLPLSSDSLAYVLPKNSANRHFFAISKLNKIKAAGYNEVALAYRASRTIGSCAQRMPNEKLIAYLPEAEQAEYKAIIERAMKVREDAKAKPLTEVEKLRAKIEKAKAALAKLQANAAEGNI